MNLRLDEEPHVVRYACHRYENLRFIKKRTVSKFDRLEDCVNKKSLYQVPNKNQVELLRYSREAIYSPKRNYGN